MMMVMMMMTMMMMMVMMMVMMMMMIMVMMIMVMVVMMMVTMMTVQVQNYNLTRDLGAEALPLISPVEEKIQTLEEKYISRFVITPLLLQHFMVCLFQQILTPENLFKIKIIILKKPLTLLSSLRLANSETKSTPRASRQAPPTLENNNEPI